MVNLDEMIAVARECVYKAMPTARKPSKVYTGDLTDYKEAVAAVGVSAKPTES